MGNYTIFLTFENPRSGKQARILPKNVPKILDLKSSSEQLFSEIDVGCPWLMRIADWLWIVCRVPRFVSIDKCENNM